MKTPLEELKEIKQGFEELNTDIKYNAKFGAASKFRDAEKSKKNICKSAIDIIEKIELSHESISVETFVNNYSDLGIILKALKDKTDVIEHILQRGVSNLNSQRQLEEQIEGIQKQEKELHRISSLFIAELKIVELEKIIGNKEVLEGKLRGEVGRKAVERAEDEFKKLSETHQRRESNWFRAFIVASIIFLGVILYVVFTTSFDESIAKVIYETFKRLLLVSTFGLAMRITMGKYNLERNLRIIYDHRSSALQQFEVFEKAISDNDINAKNQLRLEIARYVFSDPDTGYRGSSSSNELNINPVLSTFENATKQ